ncbi:tRNA (5-methylaminomethyl-2-thiouridylate)-methyltransferase [Candidatus Electrothrix aarhusensis]|uniref:tRNA-specific 2-thiouridylase MnmA n=1 Tax=Candidatus Electrothrix aarhusensis TaxID=1859131 RepID=A0A3S3RRP6_9BACT|nr:tRNA (5-methylaminomethyl-2-thiouridylate)-methyltransferase [Candidatus Electrothrix aarhusensis]
MTEKRSPCTVGVAMSGGVDSTVAAAILLEQGFSVHGFFMQLPLPGLDEQIRKVQRVADDLGIPLHLVEMEEEFRKRVIAYFTDSYCQGRTPNPCVVCNQEIKFDLLTEAILAQGMDKTATGHYAGIYQVNGINGTALLQRGKDPKKDQSYFLCRLSSQQLEHTLFPLADHCKKDIFLRAQDFGFTQFGGDESQDVCFLANQNLATFLSEQGLKSMRGEIATEDGKVLGSHEGIWKYTVGQRRGLGIPDATPWYVIKLDAKSNRVIIGKNDELFQRELLLSDVQWQLELPIPWQGKVQLRSRHQAAEAEVSPVENGNWRVRFKESQRAVTPGQFAVLYQEDMVVASGVIVS